jgi:solute carrier family 25 phosphate transporter 3
MKTMVSNPGRNALLATSDKKWDSRFSHEHAHTNQYYTYCMGAGVLSCGLTHLAVTPLDVAKCNMQVDPVKYQGLVPSIKKIMAEEGAGALFKGWFPTLLGYSAQGCFKFGLYEFFKDYYANMAGEENAKKYQGAIWLAGSASAEFFADAALCPFEMVKVRVQTAVPGTFPTGFFSALSTMRAEPGNKWPFGSLVPLWSRQIPYTMAKFYFFELVKNAFYENVFTEPKETYTKGTHLGITFASGYIAGVACAIVSHPADTVVSKMAKDSSKSAGDILSELGFGGIWGGLGTRIIMIGTLTGLQWWIYDSFKTVVGLGVGGPGLPK